MATTTRKRSSTAKKSEGQSKTGKATAEKAKTGARSTRSGNGKTAAQTKKTRSTGTRATKTASTAGKTRASSRSTTSAGAKGKTWTEEISVAGNQLVDKFKELVSEGTVRRVVIKHQGNVLLEVPLAAAIVGGALAVWAAPLIAAVTAIAGAASHVTVEVERTGERPASRAKR
jgi:Domain of unknown function (DUF4342)